MNTFTMLILLFHVDLGGDPFAQTMVEQPRRDYATLERCESAAVTKRLEMLAQARSYPQLGIVDVRITCVPTQYLFPQTDLGT
jgi:hypothetical protein